MNLKIGIGITAILISLVLTFWAGKAHEKGRYKAAFDGETAVQMYGTWYIPDGKELEKVCGQELIAKLSIEPDFHLNGDAVCERCH